MTAPVPARPASSKATRQQAIQPADRHSADVKNLLTSGLARACHYAAGRPDCQVLAAVCYGPVALCASCDQRRSSAGKGTAPVRLPDPHALLEIAAARDAATARARMKTAAFPVIKTLDELDRSACSIPGPTLDYLAPLEWITARENLCLVGPAGTGKSHVLVGVGVAAVAAGHKVRYFTAADLTETLYRGMADNSVGKVIENLLRNDLILVDEVGFAPLDDTGAQLLFRLVSAAYERRALGLASHWPFESWGRFLPEHTTAVSLLDRLLHHANVVVTAGDSYRMRQARARGGTPLNKK